MSRPAGGAAMLGWHEQSGDYRTMEANEAKLGKRFAIVRLYSQWRLPGRTVDRAVADGRLVISSHKPPEPRAGGWSAVAKGKEDAMIRALARKYRSYQREVIFTFHHEPHDDAADVKRGGRYGTAAEFVAAWRRIHRIFAEERAWAGSGGDVYFAYIATGSRALAGSPPGSADRLYPGGDTVDLLAHDRYNWAGCRKERWESFAENWKPMVALAEAQGKRLIPGEFGSAPDRGRRNQWFRDAARFITTDAQARKWLIGLSYFHSYHDGCHWDFMNQGDDGRTGWVEAFSRNDYFVGRPFSLRPEARPQQAAPAPAARPEGSWSKGQRQPGGLPKGSGEMSGLAASRRHPGWMWGVRDSGNPASLYALQATGSDAGRLSGRAIPVAGASNRDWEDVVYAEEGGAGYLYVIDTGAKRIYKVAEPDPNGDRRARTVAVYRYALPDASPKSTCGPRDNVEAAFAYPPVSGPLHLVRKMGNPARVYRFDRLDPARTNRPVPVGTLADASCISVAAVSADGMLLVTASHSTLRVRRGAGDLGSLLRGPVVFGQSIKPDNNEAGDFQPWGSHDILIGAENRSTWRFTRLS